MSTSPAQIAANRLNAQQSTGPVTPSGKARSSRNAAGPIAQFLAVGEEEQQELQDLIEAYNASLKPITAVESDLITDMAIARWRRFRLMQFESSLLSNTMDKVQAELGRDATRVQIQALALERLIDGSKTWNTLQRYIRDAERSFNTCMKQLMELPAPTSEPAKQAPLAIRKNEPNPPPPDSRFGPKIALRPNGYPVNLALAL